MGHGIGQFRRPGAFPRGVDKGEEIGKLHLPNQGQGVLKLLVSLPGEAHDHVGSKAHVGHDASGVADQLQVLLPGVAAVHLFQHPVVAGLEGQMDKVGDVPAVGDDVEQLLAGVFGVRGHKADAVVSLHGV